MPRQPDSRRSRIAAHPAVRAGRRAWPFVLGAKQRWDSLTPEQQERYRRMAREYGRRAQETLARRRRGR
jgi:hypothetical protein